MWVLDLDNYLDQNLDQGLDLEVQGLFSELEPDFKIEELVIYTFSLLNNVHFIDPDFWGYGSYYELQGLGVVGYTS